MTPEEEAAVFYPTDHLKEVIRAKIEYAKEKNEDPIDHLAWLMNSLQRDLYSRGIRSVQQGIIKVLDLRHLIGTL